MNRKEFIGSVAAFLAAGTMASPKPKFDKEAFKKYIDGMFFKHLYENIPDEMVRSWVDSYLQPLQESGAIYEYKIVDNSDRDKNELEYKFGIKTEPSEKFYIFRWKVVPTGVPIEELDHIDEINELMKGII